MNSTKEHHTYKRFFNGTTPIQRDSVVCHLDYLGYKDLIDSDKTGGLMERLYVTYLNLLQQIKAASTKSELYSVRTFSDNLLLACPIDDGDGEMEFAIILRLVSWFQREMALHGYFFRGAMEVGKLHMNEEMIFGQALVDAYLLESKVAKFPRVILGPNLRKQLVEINKNYAPDENPAKSALLNFEDDQWFVDYLRNMDLDIGVAHDYEIKRHGEQLKAKLLREKRSEVKEKYLWAARYHNYFCDKHKFPHSIANGNLDQFFEVSL